MNKQYETRNGYPVRILAIDTAIGSDGDTVVGIIKYPHSTNELESWRPDGSYRESETDAAPQSPHDLVEVPQTQTIYLNLYPDPAAAAYETRTDADRYARRARVACIKLTYTPGDGLH
jgi:hypothetical protein